MQSNVCALLEVLAKGGRLEGREKEGKTVKDVGCLTLCSLASYCCTAAVAAGVTAVDRTERMCLRKCGVVVPVCSRARGGCCCEQSWKCGGIFKKWKTH